MPTIEVRISDLAALLSKELQEENLEESLKLVKGELKEFDLASDQAKIELNDSNRPDLWSPEGIARQIRWVGSGQKLGYPHFAIQRGLDRLVNVSKGVRTIRPYLAACAVRGVEMSEVVLTQLIQTQEKLAEIFGRKRQTVSIGLYRLEQITFPIRYDLSDPDKTRFVPLGFEQEMTLREILEHHPKGRAYGGIISGHSALPVLMDAEDKVLSFPPIINSRNIGEVQASDRNLLVETTGEDLRMVMLVLNIFACNLIDRGGTVERITVRYPYKTAFGKDILMPYSFAESLSLRIKDVAVALGEVMPIAEIKRELSCYGHTVVGKGKHLKVTPPLYRDDLMHPIDLIEDIAIVRGYDSFVPEMPSEFTVGTLSQIERFSDRLRIQMIGHSFQEIISNTLASHTDLQTRMRCSDEGIVRVGNPMAESFSVLRNSLIPSLLAAEAQSAKAFYPHRVFEIGEVARLGGREGTETAVRLSALIAHATANFSELHAVAEALLYYSLIGSCLEPVDHPSFMRGRVGRLVVGEQEIGLIGEIHPEVLSNWQIGMPCVVFELELDLLL